MNGCVVSAIRARVTGKNGKGKKAMVSLPKRIYFTVEKYLGNSLSKPKNLKLLHPPINNAAS